MGDKVYYNDDDQAHRLNGPALITSFGFNYFINGKRHRLDGPAVIGIGPYHGIKEWWYQGHWIRGCCSQEEFKKLLKMKAFW